MRQRDEVKHRFDKDMGRRLRELRLEADISQLVLAEESGVNPATISLLEQGKKGTECYTAHKLARALGVDIGELFGKAVEK